MLSKLYIVIADDAGNTVLGIQEEIAPKPSKRLQELLSEPYLISRLIEDAKTAKVVGAEITKRVKPRIGVED